MLILASGSAERQAMLRAAGVQFRAVPAEIDEAALFRHWQNEPGPQVAVQLAREKALAVSRLHREALVLGADSIVEPESGGLWQKPASLAQLRAQLWELRGRRHGLHSAAVGARNGAVLWQTVESARLWVRDFSADWLDGYVRACGRAVLSSVGGYHIEGLGGQLFTRLDGDQFVVRGLPLFAVLGWLRETGELET